MISVTAGCDTLVIVDPRWGRNPTKRSLLHIASDPDIMKNTLESEKMLLYPGVFIRACALHGNMVGNKKTCYYT